jgi:hypothetical protein
MPKNAQPTSRPVHVLLGADGPGEQDFFALAFQKQLRRWNTSSSVETLARRHGSCEQPTTERRKCGRVKNYLLRHVAHAVPKDNLVSAEFASVGTGCA